MNIELATNERGDLLIISDTQFNAQIIRIEYYKDQRLFMLVYDDPDSEGDLLHYEIPEETCKLVTASANMIVVIAPDEKENVSAYKVPLIQIGI